jgi:hypothetical protein
VSKWSISREAYVWTLAGDDAYKLLWFNQSKGGVYCCHPDGSHLSIHSDGNGFSRRPKNYPELVQDSSFKLPPIAELDFHMIQGEWRSLHPDQVRHFGSRMIQRPRANSRALFVNPSQFGPLTQLVIESCLYRHNQRDSVRCWARGHHMHSSHLDPLISREYELDNHDKLLRIFIYRARFEATEDGVRAASVRPHASMPQTPE